MNKYIDYDLASNDMRKLREDAGLQEFELAKKLKITIETLVAIERNLPGAVDSMDWILKLRWRLSCEKSALQYLKLVILGQHNKKH